MKKLLILSSLALLVAPSFSSNISSDITGGAIKYFADDTTSSSEETTAYTITYHYNLTDLKSADGNTVLDTTTETVVAGGYCSEQYKYYSVDDTATVWYGTYTFLGWYVSTAEKAEKFTFNSSKIDANHDVYGKWSKTKDADCISTLKQSKTKAQLYYEYTASEGSDATNYNISKIGLRFGGFADDVSLTELLWGDSKTKSYLSSFGIAYTTVAPKNGSFVTALKNDEYKQGEVKEKSEDRGDNAFFAYTKFPTYYKEGSSEYLMFNLYFDVSVESLDKTIYAAAYLKLSNGDMFYFSETSYSVKSLATEYLNKKTELGITDTDQLATLALLKDGKTSSTDTSASDSQGE